MGSPEDLNEKPAGGQGDDAAAAGPPSEAEVQLSVDAIISSGVLGKGDRRAALLRYLVDTELSGRGGELKAFTIAVDVLGRDASFDPTTDSIVRSEIGRLRDALRIYFAESGAPGQVQIEIPKGTYRPVLSVGPAAPVSGHRAAQRRIILLALVAAVIAVAVLAFGLLKDRDGAPETDDDQLEAGLPFEVVRIALAPLEVAGDHPDDEKIALGLTAEMMMDLSAYPWIAVVSPVGGFSDLRADQVDYVLDGGIYIDDQSLRTRSRMVTLPDEQLVWSDNRTVEIEAMAIRTAIVEIASQIAFQLASAHGIVPELAKARNAHASPENLEAFLCYLGLHRYLDTPTDTEHLQLRECLSVAAAEFPTFGDGWAALGLIYIDEARFDRNPRPGADPWRDARHAIDQAMRFAPIRMTTLNVALIDSIEAPAQDMAEFRHVSDLLTALFPRHPLTLYNVGSRMAEFAGQWEDGLALVDQAISITPAPPSAYFLTQAYRAAMVGSDAEALESVADLTSTTAESELLLNYLAAARNGQVDVMQRYRALLAEQGLPQNANIVRHVRGRRYVKELETVLLEQLEGAFKREASQ